ncbi:hypothetical protein P692DRAFT_20818162 [Suillus brevipes Sb2]|nr:hypothetical protein P692DRAFT_20818162 [Suillus brevipes Sb2]
MSAESAKKHAACPVKGTAAIMEVDGEEREEDRLPEPVKNKTISKKRWNSENSPEYGPRPKMAKLGVETPKLRPNIRSVEEKSVKELRNNEGCDGWDRSTIIVDGDASAVRRELVACHPNTHQTNSNSNQKRPERITRIKLGEIVGNVLRPPPKIEIGLLGTF